MTVMRQERREDSTLRALWRDPARIKTLMRRHGALVGSAIVIGAILRLLWLGDTSFLGDQAQLLAVGRSAADFGAVILTGIPSSLGTMNPPASTWLYGPFALLGGPLAGTIFTALANVLAIALVYGIAARYFDRVAGFSASLLYATASGPVHYSRFIWQQNLLAPLVLLLFWTTLLGLVERRRGWLGWSILLWGVATELHPTAAPLVALIVLALIVSWRDLRRRDLLWAGVAAAALILPPLIWEIASHGADLAGAQRFTGGKPVVDTIALTYLGNMVSPAPSNWLGATSSYTGMGASLGWLGTLMRALLIATQVWFAGVIAWPWLAPRVKRTLAGRLPLDSKWRFTVCLALWEVAPLLLMLRHTRAIVPHYVLVDLPAAYIGMGAVIAWLALRLQEFMERRSLLASYARWLPAATLLALTVALSLGQSVGVISELATIHSGTFDGLALPLHYGTPLASESKALADAQTTAKRLHATLSIASTRVQQEPLGYLNATAANNLSATDYISAGCVAVPSTDASASQVALVVPDSTAASLLPQMSGVTQIDRIPVQGGQPYLLYDVQPSAALTNNQAIVADTSKGPQPANYAYVHLAGAGEALAIHWNGAPAMQGAGGDAVRYWYGADPRGGALANYTVTAQALDANGRPLGAPIHSSCDRLTWTSQMSLITTLPLASSLVQTGQVAAWRVSLQMAQARATRPTLGPVVLETGAITFGPTQTISAPVTFASHLP